MKIPINQWSEDDRPREKLLKKGVDTLSDAELIALLIGSGNREESAVALSQRILQAAGNHLDKLGRFSIKELMQFKGIGEAKAISITAAMELGRRRNLSKALERKEIRSSKDAFELLSPYLSDKNTEEFWVIYMKKNSISGINKISSGGLDASIVDIRLLMKFLLEKEATAFIIAHNHPSGNLQPSRSDKDLTQKIKEAAKILNLQLLDHIIAGQKNYFSFADNNLM
jgi:DNA repair protein RadC